MLTTDLYDDHELKLCEEFAVDIEAGEILDEYSTVARVPDLNICLAVNPDHCEDLPGMKYFKVYNNCNAALADRIARIKFCSPEYVIHNPGRNKENWFLNAEEVAQLVELLQRPGKNTQFPGLTIWQDLILAFNWESDGLDYQETLHNRMGNETSNPMQLNYPDSLPIDLPIPEYEKLH